jgi:hypothetical protein
MEIVKTPYFIIMDGDYTYDPKDIDRFLPFMDGYDHIIGYRPKRLPAHKPHPQAWQLGFNQGFQPFFNLLMDARANFHRWRPV